MLFCVAAGSGPALFTPADARLAARPLLGAPGARALGQRAPRPSGEPVAHPV